MTGTQASWDDRYRAADARELSWHQDVPAASLDLLDAIGAGTTASVIDIGGGASTLVDHLLRRGHDDLAVLDLSEHALALSRRRTDDHPGVTWIHHDVLTWDPPRAWDVWHDRAALHFLVDPADRAAYVGVLRRAVGPGGGVVIGAFSEDGPPQCSGLPVHRYSGAALVALLGDVEVIAQREEIHTTPRGVEQPFTWIAGRLPR